MNSKFVLDVLVHCIRPRLIERVVLGVGASLLLSTVAPAQTTLSEADAERLKRLAEMPFRYILLHKDSKPRVPKPPTSAPTTVPAPTAVPAPVSPAQPRPRLTGRAVPEPSGTEPPSQLGSGVSHSKLQSPIGDTVAKDAAATAGAAAAEPPNAAHSLETELVQPVIDMDKATTSPQGLIRDAQSGGYVTPQPVRYSEAAPTPVQVSMALDDQAGLLRVNYKVPASVGGHGGGGVLLQLPGDGADLSELLRPLPPDALASDMPPPGSGLLEIELDTTVATRLRISLVGPTERPDGAYPYFLLPVQPGRRIYGLWLSDFHRANWVKNAPDLATTLRNVLSVSVDYSRGDAQGQGDEGQFSIGQVAFLRRSP